jgi:hypothetical protein
MKKTSSSERLIYICKTARRHFPEDTNLHAICKSGSRAGVCVNVDINEILCEDVDWIYLALDTDHCRILVKTITNFPAAYRTEDFFSS